MTKVEVYDLVGPPLLSADVNIPNESEGVRGATKTLRTLLQGLPSGLPTSCSTTTDADLR